MSLKKKLLGDTMIYGISRYASLLAALFLTPIYTRLLTKADYGVMDIFNKWNMFALSILPIGLFSAMVRFYHEVKENEIERKRQSGSVLAMLLIFAIIYGLLMLAIRPLFLQILIGEEFDNIDAIYFFSIAVVMLQLIFQFSLQILRLNHRSLPYAILSLVNFLLLAGLGFQFIYFGGENILGFFRASLISSSVALLLSLYVVRNELSLQFDIPLVRKMMSYGIHFLSVFFLFQFTDVLDRYLIRTFYNLQEVGVYSIGSRLSSVILLATGSLALAWMPRAMEMRLDPDSGKVYGRMFNAYMIGGFALVSFLIVFREELIIFFAPGYLGASNIIVYLSIFNLVMGMSYVFNLGIQISTKSWVVTVAATIAILVKVVLSLLFVKSWGIQGIALSSLVEGVVYISIQHYFSQKFHRITFNYYMLAYLPMFGVVTWITAEIESFQAGVTFKVVLFALISISSLLLFRSVAYRR